MATFDEYPEYENTSLLSSSKHGINPVVQSPQNEIYESDGPREKNIYEKMVRTLMSAGLCVLVAFVMLLISAVVIHFSFSSVIQSTVHDTKILVPGTPAYSSWLESEHENRTQPSNSDLLGASQVFSTYILENIVMLNMTNPSEFLAGEAPTYKELAPVVYKKHHKKFDVTHSMDTTTLTYREMIWYTIDGKRSKIDPSTTLVTNINPAYLTLMQQKGGEKELTLSMIGPVIHRILSKLTHDFVGILFHSYRTSLLQEAFEATGDPMDKFCSHWSNGDPTSTGPYKDLTLRLHKSDPAAKIPKKTCTKLWTTNFAYSLTEPLEDALDHAQLWYDASLGDDEALHYLTSHFDGLTEKMIERIVIWLASYDKAHTWAWINDHVPQPSTQDKLYTYQDLGLFQFGQGQAIPDSSRSAKSLLDMPAIPELYYWAKEEGTDFSIDIPTCRRILPLFQRENTLLFMKQVSEKKIENVMREWDLTRDQVHKIADFMEYIGESFIGEHLKQLASSGNGLLSTKTIDEWVRAYNDPLLEWADETSLGKNQPILKSYETQDIAREEREISTISTGASDLDTTGEFIVDNGQSQLPWTRSDGSQVQIKGTDGSQFHPYVRDEDTVTVWRDRILRPEEYVFRGDIHLKDIKCKRFMLADYMFDKNSTFQMEYEGQSNMTSVYGMPLFVGKWRFYGSSKVWRERVRGIQKPVRDECDTILEVEPKTGIAMQTQDRFQVNMLLPGDSMWFKHYHPKLNQNSTLLPIAMVEEFRGLSDELASNFKSEIPRTELISKILYWTAVCFCLLCFIIGSILTLVSFALKNKVTPKTRMAVSTS